MTLRLLIVEEALKDRRGHWYEYNHAIVIEARRRGIETTVLAHRNIDSALADELGASPFFPVTSWDQVYFHPAAWRRYLGILQHNLRVVRWMTAYLHGRARFDVVLVPTVVLHHWLAWRVLASWARGRWYGKMVLTTRNNAGEYDVGSGAYRFRASARVLDRVLRSFRGLAEKGAVELASDSAELADQYTRLCSVPFRTYPHPRETEQLPAGPATKRDSGSLIFGALGPPRFEKGSDLILAAIGLVRSQRPELNVHFRLQWTGVVYDLEGREISPDAALERDPEVEFIKRDLTKAEYQENLDQCDVMLLPYRRAQYHARLSGVAIEAFQAGVPCICVSDTWIERSMAVIGAGIALEDESPDSLAQAIIRVAENIDSYRKSAIERMDTARRVHSAHAFVDQLMNLARSPVILGRGA